MTITAEGELRFRHGDNVEFFDLHVGRTRGVIDDFLWDGYWTVDVAGKPRLLHEDADEMRLVAEDSAPEFGMTSAGLADEVAKAITRATARVVGVGQDQYDLGDHQKFETMPLTALLEMALEELDDVIVYAVMQQIRFRRIAESVIRYAE